MLGSILLGFTAAACAQAEVIRMNQVQVVGTHNSYHIAPDPKVIQGAAIFDSGAKGWNYTHPPLPEQLDLGVRSFEIDLNYTTDGVIRVFHVPKLDEASTCPTFKECLANVVAWSKKHPGHVPISFLLEIKEDYAAWYKGVTPWDAAALVQLDAEVREMIPAEKLITPDDVRGSRATLEEAVLAGEWPLLEKARGRIMLAIHEQGRLRDIYTDGHTALEGRACFVRSTPGMPFSAFVIADGPDDPKIPELVKAGYYVRTRADSGLARISSGGGGPRRDTALACGAQIVSSDYPVGLPEAKSGYEVGFEGKGFRCNPVNWPGVCGELEKK